MRSLALFALCAAILTAADPAGFMMWKGPELRGFEQKLALKVDQKKMASETLANYGNHSVMVLHREASGEAEFHETQADLFIVQSGEATLIVGGTVVEPRTTAPHEIRGPSIRDGVSKRIGPGDVVHIAAKTPHQLMVADGQQVTYAVVKINAE